ncbi:MAG: phage minor head protein [Pseudomonadota bacterium]
MRLILDVNTRTAYAAGQWERFEKTRRALPYLRYVTKRDERVRDQHRSWHNLTLPVDDPFWDTHAPPNGWNCRCTLVGVTQSDYDKGTAPGGAPLNKTAPEIKQRDWYNARTGKTERVPEGIDPGWAYNPGKAAQRQGALLKAVDDKLAKFDAPLGAALAAQVLPDLLDRKSSEFASWADGLTVPRGQVFQVGALSEAVIQALAIRNIMPESAAIEVRDEDVLHTHRDSKADALPWQWYLELPRHLASPGAVLLDKTDPAGALLMVFDVEGETGKLVVKVGYEITERGEDGIKRKRKTNIIRSGKMVPHEALMDETAYEVLDGKL